MLGSNSVSEGIAFRWLCWTLKEEYLQFALLHMLATLFSKRQKKNYSHGQNTGITETVTPSLLPGKSNAVGSMYLVFLNPTAE